MSQLYRETLDIIRRLAQIETEFHTFINQLAVGNDTDPVPLMSKINEMAALRTSYVRQLEMLVTALRIKKKEG
jgi:hypothetical protein